MVIVTHEMALPGHHVIFMDDVIVEATPKICFPTPRRSAPVNFYPVILLPTRPLRKTIEQEQVYKNNLNPTNTLSKPEEGILNLLI